jgi:hypothetical protein
MTRHMYDAISANASVLKQFNPSMVAIYLTGSADIRWTSAQVALFPKAQFVRIDQGGATSPQYSATVFDAEPNAWSILNAVAATKRCTAPRPTIYCDRFDWKTIPGSYTGAIWLAAPSLSDAEAIALAATDKRVVAVQNLFAGSYDRSIVIDPYWPEKAPVAPPPPPPPPPATAYTVQVERYQPGFGWVLEQTFDTEPGTKYRARVDVHSGSGYSAWQEFQI